MFKEALLLGTFLLLLASASPLDNKLEGKADINFKEEAENKVLKRHTECPRTCANPKRSGPCERRCEHSKCKFRGCTFFKAFGEVWKPNNCTICYCKRYRTEECFEETCPENLDCFGYPKMKRPGKCCEECDFGAAKNECKLIPVRRKNFTLGDGSDSSTMCQVVLHDCYKPMVWNQDKWQVCRAKPGQATVGENTGCSGVEGSYADIVSCLQTEEGENPIMDYDDDDMSTCANYFPS